MEKAVLSDRVSSLQDELSAVTLEAERTAREAALYKEQEQVAEFIFYCWFGGKESRADLFVLVLFSDQGWRSALRAAGAPVSAGRRSFCSSEGTPEFTGNLY